MSSSPCHSSSSITILYRSPPDGLADQQPCLLIFSLLNSCTEPSKHSNLKGFLALSSLTISHSPQDKVQAPRPNSQMPHAWASVLPLHLLGPSVPQAPVICQDTLDCIMFPVFAHGTPMARNNPSPSCLLIENQIPFLGLRCHLVLCCFFLGGPFHSAEATPPVTLFWYRLIRTSLQNTALCVPVSLSFPHQTLLKLFENQAARLIGLHAPVLSTEPGTDIDQLNS